nr:NB-ARC domains-containing protein [Tanacetum cinerariifolium]
FESKFIDSISREILKKLCDGPLHVGENLVGIDFHFDKLDLSRFFGSDKESMLSNYSSHSRGFGFDFKSHCKIRVGNGLNTRFWLDSWITDQPLCTRQVRDGVENQQWTELLALYIRTFAWPLMRRFSLVRAL